MSSLRPKEAAAEIEQMQREIDKIQLESEAHAAKIFANDVKIGLITDKIANLRAEYPTV